MISSHNIKIDSFCGYPVGHLFLKHESSEKLVIIFPGLNYSYEAPLLHYACKTALSNDCDVLNIRYGFQGSQKKLNQELFNQAMKETSEAIRQIHLTQYQQFFFIGKSFGTVIAGEMSLKMKWTNLKMAFLTPVPEAIPYIKQSGGLVIVGTKDKYFKDEHIQEIRDVENVTLRVVQNAGHSLEIENDYKASIRILENVTACCEKLFRNS